MRSIFRRASLSLISALSLAAVTACGGPAEPPAAPSAPAAPAAPSAPAAPAAPSAPAAPAAPAASSASATPTAEAPPAAAGLAKPWKDMSQGEKKTHMKTVVMPKMTALFQEFDKKQFADVNCMTCHGPTAKTGNFQMPNPALPKLTPADQFKKHMTAKPEITKFMMAKVVGEMRSLIGAPGYDPKTHSGFGCNGCHIIEK